jgi:PAS domain-containing protein
MTRPRLFERQLRRFGLSEHAAPSLEEWQRYLACVDRTYTAAEQDRYTLERSLAISSREMRELYDDLKRTSDARLAEKRDLLTKSVGIHDAILEAALDGVMIVDEQQSVVGWSKRFLELWRVSSEDIRPTNRAQRAALFAVKLKDPAAFAARL